MSPEDRRHHPRAVMPLLVQYRFDAFEELRAEYVDDISESGLFLRDPGRRSVGDRLHLQFILRNGDRLAELEGAVVRVESSGAETGIGVQFVDLDHGARETLSALMAANPAAALETEDLLAAGP